MPSNEPEWLTRKRRIAPKLSSLGWEVVPFDENQPVANFTHHAIEEFQTDNGPADYALVVDGQILGVVEAKKLTVGPQGVLTQAERYSNGIADSAFNFRGFRVPFLYSTNGEKIRFQDIRHPLNLSHWTSGFHTPDALREPASELLERIRAEKRKQNGTQKNHPSDQSV